MLKSIGCFIAFMWCMLFLAGNGFVMAVTFAVIFMVILLQVFIFDKEK